MKNFHVLASIKNSQNYRKMKNFHVLAPCEVQISLAPLARAPPKQEMSKNIELSCASTYQNRSKMKNFMIASAR